MIIILAGEGDERGVEGRQDRYINSLKFVRFRMEFRISPACETKV